MNRRFYCAVGVASGVLLLGGGVAEAAGTVHEADRHIDPTVVLGLPTDAFSPIREQQRPAASVGTKLKGANNRTRGRGQAEVQPNTESLSNKGTTNTAGADRTEQLPGLGALGGLGNNLGSKGSKGSKGGKAGGDGLLGGLLGGIPGGALLGKLTAAGSPIGGLLGGGLLGSLTGGLNPAAADGGSPAAAPTANSPRTQDPATGNSPRTQDPATRGGDDFPADWRQPAPHGDQRPGDRPTGDRPNGDRPNGDRPTGERPTGERPSGERPNGSSANDMADPAMTGMMDPAFGGMMNPAWQFPSSGQADDTAAARGTAVREPVSGTDDFGDGPEESQSAAKVTPLPGSAFGPLGRLEILGGDTLAGLPFLGDLLGGGLSLKTLDNLPAITDVVGLAGERDAAKTSAAPASAAKTASAPGKVPVVGNVGRMLLGGESAKGPTEAAVVGGSLARVAERRALTRRAIDKAKVTPELVALFDPAALDLQGDSGITHQLPLAG